VGRKGVEQLLAVVMPKTHRGMHSPCPSQLTERLLPVSHRPDETGNRESHRTASKASARPMNKHQARAGGRVLRY